jgi:lipopolysaccharide export system protein LptA
VRRSATVITILLLAAAAYPAEREVPTKITSQILEVDYENFVGTFEKDVVVTDPKGRMTADKIVVFFDSRGKEIKKIEAFGDVVIKLEGRESNSQKAIYTPEDGKIVLTGDPLVEEGKNIYAADRITIYRWEDRVIFEPKAKFILHKDDRNRI